MHVIFDFDDTLTDTTRYWNFWLSQLEGIGVDRAHAIATGSRLFVETFTLQKHLDALCVDVASAKSLIELMEKHVREFGESYIFEDVHPFLFEQQNAHDFSLLTYGDEINQTWRVNESGIRTFFEPIRVAGPHKHKVHFLKEVLETVTTPLVFVDDSPNELNPVVDACLPITLYRIVRPGAKHDYAHERDDVAWKRIGSMNEIAL